MCRAEGPRGLQEGPLLPRGAVPGGTRRNRAGALSPTAAQGCSPGRGWGLVQVQASGSRVLPFPWNSVYAGAWWAETRTGHPEPCGHVPVHQWPDLG